MQQVTNPFAGGANQLLTFGGTYAKSEIDGVQLQSFGVAETASVMVMGNATTNPPIVRLIGVDDSATLVSLDMLQLDGTDTVMPVVDGVADLRALYGVDTDNDGRIDNWVAPTAANFTAADLTAGTLVANDRLLTIMAVRVGLVLRSDRIERDEVAPASVTLFSDLAGLEYTHAIDSSLRHQRFRTVEFTVPLRNVMLTARAALAAAP